MEKTQERQKNDITKIRIKSIQAASLYRVNNDYRFVTEKKKDYNGNNDNIKEYKDSFLDFGNAVINKSLFTEYVLKHGVKVNKYGMSFDFVMMKFDWGVKEDDSDKKNIKPAMTQQQLRDYYYDKGATITWKTFDTKTGEEIKKKEKTITYKMLLRSTGKAKEGHCLFVREELHKKMLSYITMDLWDKMPNKEGAKIVEMSAYAPLITATAIDYIEIPLNNIFVLKDQKSSCHKRAISVETREVKYTDKKTNTTYCQNECYCNRGSDKFEITNILWDGMGLIDDSIFPDNMEGFIYCRSHFFKSCLFRGNIQEYFKDYYKDNYDEIYVTDITGRNIKITDIKVIITENSLKWFKFLDLMSESGTVEDAFKYYSKVMKRNDEKFAIVKTAHGSKYDDLQRSSFQMNNTLLTTDQDILKEIAAPSIEYCNKLKTDDEAFLKYLKVTGSTKYSINNVLIDLYRLNDKFRYMEYFKDKRTSKINKLKDQRIKLGKLFQQGDNLTICGNPIAMLMKTTGQSYFDEDCFQQFDDRIQCYTTRFAKGEKLAGFRSPHNSPNNIVYLENVYPQQIEKYFPDLGDHVIIINGIGTDVQSRLNGQDLDTDSIYTTNQKNIVELAKKAYVEHPTIINKIESVENSIYDKSMLSYSKMDSDISSAQYEIGLASNTAQLALSYWFDGGCEDRQLEDVFIICSVLAQVAIDSSKRSFNVKVDIELDRIKKMECMKHDPKYPVFYAKIQKSKKEFKIRNENIGYLNCPMDLIYDIVEKGIIDLRKNKNLNTPIYKEGEYGIRHIFEYKADKIKVDRKQYNKIVNIVKEYDKNIKGLDISKDSYNEERLNEFEICVESLKKLTISKDTMYTLIAYAFKPRNEKIRDSLLIVLYDKDKKLFLSCFKREKSPQKNPKSIDISEDSIFTYGGEHKRSAS